MKTEIINQREIYLYLIGFKKDELEFIENKKIWKLTSKNF